MKMKGVLSQGLILPLTTDLPQEDGTDLTDTLGITLFEREQGGPGGSGLGYSRNSNWPHFLQKTDQERIQNCAVQVRVLRHENPELDQWEVTEKLDGSSMTVYCVQSGDNEYKLGVCSRNCELETEINELTGQAKSTYWHTAFRYNIPAALEEYCRKEGRQLALQGELIGPGIQGNKYGLAEHQFVLYDVYNIEARCYLTAGSRRVIAAALGLPHVPILNTNQNTEFSNVDAILAYAEGKSVLADTEREGVVFKNLFNPMFSFKAISNSYLLKHE
jgi:RNA ligase (TIGR02306 family)